MSLDVGCVRCGDDLAAPGGLLFSAPDERGMVSKAHLCSGCYWRVIDFIGATVGEDT